MHDLNIQISHQSDDNQSFTAITLKGSPQLSPVLGTTVDANPDSLVPAAPSEMADALASVSKELGCENTLEDMLFAIDRLRANPQARHADSAVKILPDGTEVPASDLRTDHIAVRHPDGTTIFTVSIGSDDLTQDEAVSRVKELTLLGHSDWELASREVWERYVLDLTKFRPAVDTNLYPGIKPEWHWTSTYCAWADKDAAGVPVSAWVVGADSGYVGHGRRGSRGYALAVRRAGQ